MMKVQGMLTLSSEPPYMYFAPNGAGLRVGCRCDCSLADLRCLLFELGFDDQQPASWSPKELVIRCDGDFSSKVLSKFGLLPASQRLSNKKSS